MSFEKYRIWQKAIGSPIHMSFRELKNIGVALFGVGLLLCSIVVAAMKIVLSPLRWLVEPMKIIHDHKDDDQFWDNVKGVSKIK